MSVFVVCPNGEGDPFACEPFCALCEGSGQVLSCDACRVDRQGVGACVCGEEGCFMVVCLDCGDNFEKDCEQNTEQAGHVFGVVCVGRFCSVCSLGWG